MGCSVSDTLHTAHILEQKTPTHKPQWSLILSEPRQPKIKQNHMIEHSATLWRCSVLTYIKELTHCQIPPESRSPLGKLRSGHKPLPDWHWVEKRELREEVMHTVMYPAHMQNDSLMGLALLLHMALPFTKVEESKRKQTKCKSWRTGELLLGCTTPSISSSVRIWQVMKCFVM